MAGNRRGRRSVLAVMILPPSYRPSRFVFSLFVVVLFTSTSSRSAWAQQSLFNVPSGKVTPAGEFFFQEQIALARTGESNLVTEVGLGKHFEVGIDINHVRLYPREVAPTVGDPAGNAFVANAQWIVPAKQWLYVAFGTQQGVSAYQPNRTAEYVGMGWTALRIEPANGHYGAYVVGGYYGTHSFTGNGRPEGGLVGFEAPILGEHLSICADWVVGTNRLSVAVIGLQVTPVPAWGWQLSVGAQLPALSTDTGYAFIVEFTRMHGVKNHEQAVGRTLLTPDHPHHAS